VNTRPGLQTMREGGGLELLGVPGIVRGGDLLERVDAIDVYA
jgi:hypothetical protein